MEESSRASAVRVLSASAVHASLEALAVAFAKGGGEVKLAFETAPAMAKKLAAGERADVIIVPPAAMADLVATGKATAGAQQVLGRVGVGVAIRADAPVPDISSTEALKRSLLAADSVAYNRASSGVYVEGLMEKLGLAQALRAKTVRHHDALQLFTHLLAGKGREIGFGGLTEIARWRDQGLKLVGPLPADIQNYTTYVAALSADPPSPANARAFLLFLGGAEARAILLAHGVS
jgi:molybdate transport system substrate-binding protein